MIGNDLIGFIEVQAKFLKALIPATRLIRCSRSPRSSAADDRRRPDEGYVHNQESALVLEGTHAYLVRLSPTATRIHRLPREPAFNRGEGMLAGVRDGGVVVLAGPARLPALGRGSDKPPDFSARTYGRRSVLALGKQRDSIRWVEVRAVNLFGRQCGEAIRQGGSFAVFRKAAKGETQSFASQREGLACHPRSVVSHQALRIGRGAAARGRQGRGHNAVVARGHSTGLRPEPHNP